MTRVGEPEVFVFIWIKVAASHGFPHMSNRVTVPLCLLWSFSLKAKPSKPLNSSYPVRQDSPTVFPRCPVKRGCKGGGVKPPFHPFPLMSGPDKSPLLLVERHVCPPLPTAEICPWCNHPCLSPWQPSLLPAVGCHASHLPSCSSSPISTVL